MFYYSFDIGGTSIKHAIVSSTGEIIERFENIPTGCKITDFEIQEVIHRCVLNNKKEYNIEGIAISSTGVVDPQNKRVIFSGPTLPHYGQSDIFLELEKLLSIPVSVENDVNCAALGELWKGSLKGSSESLLLTVGTGIGGSIILDGHIYRGFRYSAGEVGYMDLGNGLFQELASTRHLVEMVSKIKKLEMNGYDVIELAKKGDKETILYLEKWIDNLVKGIANIAYLINPEKIVLGGGIMGEFDFLYPMIEETMKKEIIHPFFNFKIEKALLGNDAGLLGAVKHHIDL